MLTMGSYIASLSFEIEEKLLSPSTRSESNVFAILMKGFLQILPVYASVSTDIQFADF